MKYQPTVLTKPNNVTQLFVLNELAHSSRQENEYFLKTRLAPKFGGRLPEVMRFKSALENEIWLP